MAEALELLKTKRLIIESKLTRIEDFVKKFKAKDDVEQLETRKDVLNVIFSDFDKLQTEIELLNADELKSDCRSSFESRYFDIITSINNKSQKKQTATKSNANAVEPKKAHVKLPEISLPTFSGSYTDWLQFSDTFSDLIDNNKSITDCMKFHYLKRSLTGDASKVLENLTISGSNYDAAWDTLKKRYDNKRLIVQEHLNNILHAPIISKSSGVALRQLLDTLNVNLEALKLLSVPVSEWDVILIAIITPKLDFHTNREWQSKLTQKLPTMKAFNEFLECRWQLLESMQASASKNGSNSNPKAYQKKEDEKNTNSSKKFTTVHFSSSEIQGCFNCKKAHPLYQCQQFLSLSPKDRLKRAKELNLCINCLRHNHSTSTCKSVSCKQCNKRHHTLLHFNPSSTQINNESESNTQVRNDAPPTDAASTSLNMHCYSSSPFQQVLLSTAEIFIKNSENNFIKCRVLLDGGSQSNLITKSLYNKLKIPAKNINHTIIGINQVQSSIKQSVQTTIRSCITQYETKLDCLITEKITHNLPLVSFKKSTLEIPKDIQIADPNFNLNNPIDMLIGAELFWDLLLMNQIKLTNNQPVWQDTQFGWIVGGPIPYNNRKNTSLALCTLSIDDMNSLEQQVDQFFEMENCEDDKPLKRNDDLCELHFRSTFNRNENGRFIIKLPFIHNPPRLGNSYNDAKRFLFNLERKFKKVPDLKEQYCNFMTEYESLGHMDPIELDNFKTTDKACFLPHHGVFKKSENSSKIRVVFNASHKTANGLSLNDNLMNGPVVQDELFSILLRFRTYQYIITADITKFYRQISMHPDHCNYQLILWRQNEKENIQGFRLNTLTYGTKPASFIASRCLQQLSLEAAADYPTTSNIIARDFYMDDLITGANTVAEVVKIREEVTNILEGAQLPICKWSSNDVSVLPITDTKDSTDGTNHLNFAKLGQSKTLGLLWNKEDDTLRYNVDLNPLVPVVSKRVILSVISKIFDPLGLVGPVITNAKILLQEIWSLKLKWDEQVPDYIERKWNELCNSLDSLPLLTIPRKIIPNATPNLIEIHGFADASMKAYGAAIYIRTQLSENEFSTYLLCSKSRVAPIKTISLPRLELCAARLLSRLINKAQNALNLNFAKRVLWTDSTIVLAWICSPANSWNIFVANRVAEIQGLTRVDEWRHVRTNLNPADIISRGLEPLKLIHSNLWFNGPSFLCQPESAWPLSETEPTNEIPEAKGIALVCSKTATEHSVFTKFSSFTKLKRVIAYVYRFIHNAKNKSMKIYGSLSVSELEQATSVIVKNVQATYFSEEIDQIKQNKNINKSSKIRSLDPFIDARGILRVGGRLKHSEVSYDCKHQIILPRKHHVTYLIIHYEHMRNLHSGTLSTLAAIRQRFWVPNGRSSVRHVIHKCYQCFRAKPTGMIQKMGDLPSARTQLVRPFLQTGVDYAGPFLVKSGFLKQARSIKSYIVLFICFATKAVHLELASDLTTDAFLNAFRRFISRRGFVSDLFSDNGTNFVGAKTQMDQVYQFLNSNEFQGQVIDPLTIDNVKWHFIPPRSPHMGGLWEVNVRSVKRHLKNLMTADMSFNFEEMTTLLCRIEACLNSRPITPLSSEPNDLTYLTPGHFLIGTPLTCPLESDVTQIKLNRLSRWQRIEMIRQHFWKRWRREYLTTLQHRSKWHLTNREINVGMMVIVLEDNIPPQMWKLGRISELHPGSDGVVRVVTVKTASNTFKRSIHKLAPLPMEQDSSASDSDQGIK